MSVIPSFILVQVYLSDRHQIYLLTRGPMVFPEVDRSVKQIKFHLKSLPLQDRKTGINSNNLPSSEGRNLSFATLSVWIDWKMDEWKWKQDEYLLEDTRPEERVPFLEFFGPCLFEKGFKVVSGKGVEMLY